MAKGKGDIILRDRLEFGLDSNGSVAARYGRISLDDYVDIVSRKGLLLKEIKFHLLQQSPSGEFVNALVNTGIVPIVGITPTATDGIHASGLKVWATTEAYQNGFDVGISSPNVYAIWERAWVNQFESEVSGITSSVWATDQYYGVDDLHPTGVGIISDLLIGIAVDGMDVYDDANSTIQLDVMMVCEQKTFTVSDFQEMFAQQQDV